MRIEDVRIQFEKAQNVPFDWFGFDAIAFVMGAYVIFIIILFLMILAKAREGYLKMVAAFLILFLVHAVFAKIESQEKISENIAKWRLDYAIPYINSLPKEKHEVIFVKIEANSSQEIKDNGLWLYSNEIQRTPLTVSFKGNTGIETQTYWYSTDMSLTPEQKPYVEYTVLPEDLGVTTDGKKVEFWAGRYNHKIYLPENYQFTDIK